MKQLLVAIVFLAMAGIAHAGTVCSNGCSVGNEGLGWCGSNQVDCANDENNCGAVGNACAPGISCTEGICQDLRPCYGPGGCGAAAKPLIINREFRLKPIRLKVT